MKINNVKTYAVKNDNFTRGGKYWFFLKVETDENISGWGEVYWYTLSPEALKQTVEDVAQEFFISKDPHHIESMYGEYYRYHCNQHSDLSKMGVFSGFEMACWDIIGKAAGKPIYELMGGLCNERVRAYSYLYYEDRTKRPESLWMNPELCAKRAVDFMNMGFTAVKFDPMDYVEMPPPPWTPPVASYERSEKCVAAIREAVGNSCDIIIGTHGQFTPSAAIRFAKRMEKYDPMWFEEPLPPENPAAIKKVVQATSIPIATGERLATKYEYVPLLRAGVDIVQIDLGGVGGILEAKKIAGMAEAHHAQITTHCFSGPLNFAAQMQLAACCPNFLIQEAVGTMDGIHSELFIKPVEWRDGYFIPPKEPGLGVEMDENALDKYTVSSFERNEL